ncbi:acyl carrier protein [Clostridium estertheticum]|uniref:acyl carrier protein n=1 Tax=Clostridium estertheticum TaxID=238834 RepID=UPI0013EEAAEA|nr:acyl carrier protein [Clostridium estertheticum]MBZ9609070.1 acyl carrier protein [Clostridium estertheticum]
MDNSITFEDFKKIFSEYLGIDIKKLTRDVNILFELGVDSLSLVNSMIRLEKEYNVRFEGEDKIMTRTLGEAYDLFNKYRNE